MSAAKIDVSLATLPVLVTASYKANKGTSIKVLDDLKRLDKDVHELILGVKDEGVSDVETLGDSHESFGLQWNMLKSLATSLDLTNFQKKQFTNDLQNIDQRIKSILKIINSPKFSKEIAASVAVERVLLTSPEVLQINYETNAKVALAVQKGFVKLTEMFQQLKPEITLVNNPTHEKLRLIEAKNKKLLTVMEESEQLSANQKNFFKTYFEIFESQRVQYLSTWGLLSSYKNVKEVNAPDLSLDGNNPEEQINQFLDPSNKTPVSSLSTVVAIPKEKSKEEKKEVRERAPSSADAPNQNLQRRPSLSLSGSLKRLSINPFKQTKDPSSSPKGDEKPKTEDIKPIMGKSKEELSPKDKTPDTVKLETKPDTSSSNTPAESPKDKSSLEPPASPPPDDRSKPADHMNLRNSSMIRKWLARGKETKSSTPNL